MARFQYQVTTKPVFVPASTAVSEDRWHQPWSEPPRFKRLPTALAAPFLALVESAPFPEAVTESRWHQPWSEPPVKAKPGLRSTAQQFIAFQPSPSPFAATGWFDWLSEPVRFKQGLPAREQQFLALHPAPSPFVQTGWFEWLSEPVRQKKGLPANLQQFFTTDSAVIPVTKLIEWFAPYSEPVRIKPGEKAALQQFLAYPPRILPTPSITAALSAQEELDSLLFGATSYNAVISAEASVRELRHQLSPVAIIENLKKLGSVSIQASLPLTSSGSAVGSVATARVAIREV